MPWIYGGTPSMNALKNQGLEIQYDIYIYYISMGNSTSNMGSKLSS